MRFPSLIPVLISAAGFVGQPAHANPHPNVLFISIDDQNDWIGALGRHPLAKTPHIDGLAARGTVMLNAHCQAPLCNPSRTSVLLGVRPSTSGIYTLSPSFRTVPELRDRVTLPQHFKAHGYRTLANGKVFHGWASDQVVGQRVRGPSSDGSAAPTVVRIPGSMEFDQVGMVRGIGPRPAVRLVPAEAAGSHPQLDWGAFPHKDEEKGDYLLASWAIEELKNSPRDHPAFIAVGFMLPHVPIYVNQSWLDLYPDDDSVLPPIRRDDREDVPFFSWFLHWKLPEPRLRSIEEGHQWRGLVRAYLAATSFIDAQVGRILSAIDGLGLADSTIVVLWSDHGWHLGEKGITGKNTLWEESTRVPLIFAGPGVAAGGRCPQPVELLDIYPTLIELCRLAPRADLEGLSLGPQLKNAATPRSRPAITTANQGNHSVRSSRWRFIQYADGTEELYDHASDSREWTNLAPRPEYAAVLAEHRRWLPRINQPPVPGSSGRSLNYDPESDTVTWEGKQVRRSDELPR